MRNPKNASCSLPRGMNAARQYGNRWSYENVARCELQKENWTGNRKIFENVHLRKFNFEAFRGTFLPRVRIRGKNHMRVSNQWNSGWKCFVGSTTKSHRISTCEKEVVPKFWVPSPASRFQWYCGWGNFFRIRKVATCTSSLPARWSTSGSGHQWLVIATKIHGGVAGLDGKESFEHVQNPLPKRSLWYIYIYRHIWMIYIDLLWYTQKALKLYHQLLNPHLSVNPQPRFGCISLTFGINQFHVGFKLQGSEHNQCWSCFAIFGCASQPASGSQSRLLRRVTVTRSQTRCLAQWRVWSVRCSQFAFPRRAP